MRGLRVLFIVTAVLLMAGMASGATRAFSDVTGVVETGWSGELRLPKFDPAWGTLNSVTLEYGGELTASLAFESRDRRPAQITGTVQGLMRFYPTPYHAPNPFDVTKTFSQTFAATAYDGVMDFGGTSGHTYDDSNSGLHSGFTGSSDPGIKTLFSGSGEIVIPWEVSGTAYGSGAGNLVLMTGLLASGDARVVYEYTPVPEPSGLLALLPGIAGLVGTLRLRRR